MDIISSAKILSRIGLRAVKSMEKSVSSAEGVGLTDVAITADRGASLFNTGKHLFMKGSEIPYEQIMNAAVENSLTPTVVDLEDVGKVSITGDPFALGEVLDDCQGDNIFNFQGDCGLVTITNMLKMAGVDITEDEMVATAIRENLCVFSNTFDPTDNGGTTVFDRLKLLEGFGIDASIFDDKAGLGSIESLAEFVEEGHGVNISVNAGYAWDDPESVGDGTSNHSILVTGTVRDEAGNLQGFYVCDSGLTDTESGARFLSVDQLERCYTNVPGTTAMVTDNPIR